VSVKQIREQFNDSGDSIATSFVKVWSKSTLYKTANKLVSVPQPIESACITYPIQVTKISGTMGLSLQTQVIFSNLTFPSVTMLLMTIVIKDFIER